MSTHEHWEQILSIEGKIDHLLELDMSHVKYLYATCTPHHLDPKLRRSIGRSLRGALGYGLREVSCVGRCEGGPQGIEKSCVEPACPYARGFLALGTAQGAPAPYRLEQRDLHQDGEAELLCTSLALYGPLAEDHLFWIWGLQRALLRGLNTEKGSAPLELMYAIDLFDTLEVWSLDGCTFPVTPKVASLHEWIETRYHKACSAYERGKRRLTISLMSPLETRAPLGYENERAVIPIERFLQLIARRLEGLFETYWLPIDAHEGYERLSQKELLKVCEGVRLYFADLKNLNQKARPTGGSERGVPQYSGGFTYELSDEPAHSKLLLKLVCVGELIGIGRGVVEGRGALSFTLS